MPDTTSILQVAQSYGLLGFGAVVFLVLVVCVAAHVVAQPGEQVSLLYGLATYTKKKMSARRSAPKKPIEFVYEPAGVFWRIQIPMEDWIDGDLTKLRDPYIDGILAGPYHQTCKSDLGFFDGSAGVSGRWRVCRRCRGCGAEILAEEVPDDRLHFKREMVKLLQETHFSGRKIPDGLVFTSRGGPE